MQEWMKDSSYYNTVNSYGPPYILYILLYIIYITLYFFHISYKYERNTSVIRLQVFRNSFVR